MQSNGLLARPVGKKLALVDDQPGVTRDLREGEARLGDLKFTVIDTAGLEEATDESLKSALVRMVHLRREFKAPPKKGKKQPNKVAVADMSLTLDGNRAKNNGTCTVVIRSWQAYFHNLHVINSPVDGIRITNLAMDGKTGLKSTQVNGRISNCFVELSGAAGVRSVARVGLRAASAGRPGWRRRL